MVERGHAFYQSTVNKIENGTRKVSFAEGWDLSHVLEVSPSTLLFGGLETVKRQAAGIRELTAEIQKGSRLVVRMARLTSGEIIELKQRLEQLRTTIAARPDEASQEVGLQAVLEAADAWAAVDALAPVAGIELPGG
jgi:hypothetical protein